MLAEDEICLTSPVESLFLRVDIIRSNYVYAKMRNKNVCLCCIRLRVS